MRRNRSTTVRVLLASALMIVVGFFAAHMFMGKRPAAKEPVTFISSSNFELSDLMRPSDP